MFTKSTKTPFEAEIILFRVFILHKMFIFLVYRVVSQMHVFVVFVYFRCVGFTCKSSQSFLKYIDSHWFIRSD